MFVVVGDTGTSNRSTNTAVPYYYYNNRSTSKKNNYFVIPSSFNGDATQFSWGKS